MLRSNWILQVCLCSIFLLIFSLASAQEESLKVLTYNIHHANPPSKPDYIDMDAIEKVIRESGADLVALQELDVNNRRSGVELDQAAELGRRLGMHHYFVKGIDYEGGAYGIGILSRYPLKSADSLRLPMAAGVRGEPRVMAVVEVEPAEGKPLLFACTHLDLKPETRILQAEAIVTYFKDRKEPVILGGDLNAVPESDVIQYLEKHFTRSKTSGAAGFTIPVDRPARTIDYMFYRPESNINVDVHRVIPEPYASDHLPVLVEMIYQ